MRPILFLTACLALAGCQSVRDDSDFPTLHPRERALYTSLTFSPGEQVIQLAGLTRTRQSERFDLIDASGSSWTVEVNLRANREGASLYSGTLELKSTDGVWSSQHRLLPRSSGRWQFALEPDSAAHGFAGLLVEIEPDPYWEMDQQRPARMPRAFGP